MKIGTEEQPYELPSVDTSRYHPTQPGPLMVFNPALKQVEVWQDGNLVAWSDQELPNFPQWLEWVKAEYAPQQFKPQHPDLRKKAQPTPAPLVKTDAVPTTAPPVRAA